MKSLELSYSIEPRPDRREETTGVFHSTVLDLKEGRKVHQRDLVKRKQQGKEEVAGKRKKEDRVSRSWLSARLIGEQKNV